MGKTVKWCLKTTGNLKLNVEIYINRKAKNQLLASSWDVTKPLFGDFENFHLAHFPGTKIEKKSLLTNRILTPSP